MRRPASNCKNDCSCAWAKRMSNYSDDTFGMNCPGTVLQTVYNRIHPPSDDKMLGAISFEEMPPWAALGHRSYPRIGRDLPVMPQVRRDGSRHRDGSRQK